MVLLTGRNRTLKLINSSKTDFNVSCPFKKSYFSSASWSCLERWGPPSLFQAGSASRATPCCCTCLMFSCCESCCSRVFDYKPSQAISTEVGWWVVSARYYSLRLRYVNLLLLLSVMLVKNFDYLRIHADFKIQHCYDMLSFVVSM